MYWPKVRNKTAPLQELKGAVLYFLGEKEDLWTTVESQRKEKAMGYQPMKEM